MTRSFSRIAVTLVGLAFAATACGGEGAAATVPVVDAETTAAATEQVVAFTLSHPLITPGSATVKTGKPIAFNVTNNAPNAHTWALLAEGIQWQSIDDLDTTQILVETRWLAYQSTEILRLPGLEPGTYQIVCTINRHLDLGMVAELVVEG